VVSPDFEKLYEKYRESVDKRIAALIKAGEPATVYLPIRYVFGAGGKRLRAVLVLLSCEAVGGESHDALDAAAAVEILHNFTLVHDDVMDHADLRRGKPTVHKKWDENVAILTGDEMIAQAYRSLLRTSSPRLTQIMSVYTDALVQVCEGQGMDKEFESRKDVRLGEYFRMIARKTGKIIAASAEIGALVGGAQRNVASRMRKFGQQLGRAFQIQDDLLDITGDARKFGKIIGGDIVEGKKTYLLLKALERAGGADYDLLKSISPASGMSGAKIRKILGIYRQTGAIDEAEKEIKLSTQRALRTLAPLQQSRAKSMLIWLSRRLLERSS